MVNKKVLVCDDDSGILDITKIVLEQAGFEVQTLINSNLVFEEIHKFHPGVVMVDLWMPGLSGEEITRRIKQDGELKNVAVVVFSAHQETAKIAKNAGADDFILKPFDIKVLASTVKKYT